MNYNDVIKIVDDFYKKFENKTIRYWVYKKCFTPYEQERKFADEVVFENLECYYGKILDAYPLPDGDILLEIIEPGDEWYKDYYKLSEIKIAHSEKDEEEDNDD